MKNIRAFANHLLNALEKSFRACLSIVQKFRTYFDVRDKNIRMYIESGKDKTPEFVEFYKQLVVSFPDAEIISSYVPETEKFGNAAFNVREAIKRSDVCVFFLENAECAFQNEIEIAKLRYKPILFFVTLTARNHEKFQKDDKYKYHGFARFSVETTSQIVVFMSDFISKYS